MNVIRGTFVRGPLHAEARKDEPSGAAAAAAAEVEAELQAWLEARGSKIQGVSVAPASGVSGRAASCTPPPPPPPRDPPPHSPWLPSLCSYRSICNLSLHLSMHCCEA